MHRLNCECIVGESRSSEHDVSSLSCRVFIAARVIYMPNTSTGGCYGWVSCDRVKILVLMTLSEFRRLDVFYELFLKSMLLPVWRQR